ncbi:DUF421 domain-containing protein [Peribacillus deserti]|uniref:DUF421 domain-containing protein n=1 Tax=Peribacillus deserti TaxID=673318 RepID=A0A2N5LZS8_9BACI|nr:DUF421 domain-containing protein [Peribacillus deserti]PLT27627.1 hypothetical protein CUU66_22880 [Peribacillus deserti]
MPEFIEVFLRTILAFSMLFLASRFLGKQTLTQMTYFDFIASITMGAIIANLSFNISVKTHHMVLSFCWFVLVIFLIATLSLKHRKARKFLAGDPTIVIQNGKVLEHNMKKMRYTLDYLNQQLRAKNVFNIHEVQFALLEINGTLTVQKKPQYRHVTFEDLFSTYSSEKSLPIELIMDGKIIDSNLAENNLKPAWLQTELQKRNLEQKDVFYAVLAANGQLFIDTYKDNIGIPLDKEPNQHLM